MKWQVFKLEVNLENDAFQDSDELARILRSTADKIEAGLSVASLFDANGNFVGSAKTITRNG